MSKTKTKKVELANPEGADNMDAVVAEGRVRKEPKLSFDERTKQTVPYLDADGNQVNGSDVNADMDAEDYTPEPQIVETEETIELRKKLDKEAKKNKKKGKK